MFSNMFNNKLTNCLLIFKLSVLFRSVSANYYEKMQIVCINFAKEVYFIYSFSESLKF